MSSDIVNVGTDTKKWRQLLNNLRNLQEPLPYLKNQSDFDRVICVLPKLDNPRIIRQHGAFFLFGIQDGERDKISKLDLAMIKCKIKANKKREIMKQLDQLGINEKYCFPEIDKVAHYLKENL